MSGAPLLAAEALSARHGAVEVLRGLSLTLRAGEAVALLGRNGAGKSTLAHALFNLGPHRAGRVWAMGQDITHWPTHRIARLGLALVPQGRGLFPGLTVLENLRLATLRAPRGDWSLERVLGLFPRLAERRAASASALSGGERQMLAIGRALLTQPRLLVLDEPSEGLAPMMAEEILLTQVRRLAREGLTVLLAEQNLGLALRLCPRALVLAGGGLVFDGTADALRADTAFVREHLGV